MLSSTYTPRPRTDTPESLVRTLEDLAKNCSKSIPDICKLAENLAEVFRRGELNTDNLENLNQLNQMLKRLNRSASKVRISHPQQSGHVAKITSQLAELEARLAEEAPNLSAPPRKPLAMFNKSNSNSDLDTQFMYPTSAAISSLERLARPELFAPAIHHIEGDGEGGATEYWITGPDITQSETLVFGYNGPVLDRDPRLPGVNMRQQSR